MKKILEITKEFVSFMEKALPPFNVNSLAQSAALAVFSDKNFVLKTRNLILKEKKYLYRALDGLGLDYILSQANFILINVNKDTVKIFKEMLKCGIIVRDMKQYGLNTYIRATIGKPSENRRFIEVLRKVMGHR